MLQHRPLPEWVADDVLLSPDLAPRLLSNLEVQDACARRVCKAWKSAWDATDSMRRYLRFAPPLGELDLDLRGCFHATAFPDDQRLAIVPLCAQRTDDGLLRSGHALKIVDRSMQLLHELDRPELNSLISPDGVAITEDAIFVSSD
eukprot:2045995-Prymnesium_polylepis.1